MGTGKEVGLERLTSGVRVALECGAGGICEVQRLINLPSPWSLSMQRGPADDVLPA